MNKKPVYFNCAVMITGLAFVIGLIGPALAAQPDDVPFFTEILNRLDLIEEKIDNQTTDLQGVTQNWDKKLDSTNGEANGCNSDRFTCLWGDTVVRDNETGLVWDRSPDIMNGQNQNGTVEWIAAVNSCQSRKVGDRKGFHLPMQDQLMTLVDTTNTDPALPTGHPFLNVQSGGGASYWTATTDVERAFVADTVGFSNGGAGASNKTISANVWCVRGGQSYDGEEVQRVIDVLP